MEALLVSLVVSGSRNIPYIRIEKKVMYSSCGGSGPWFVLRRQLFFSAAAAPMDRTGGRPLAVWGNKMGIRDAA